MEKVYKVGEFAQLINRSIQTLRLWDKEGKLVPKRLPSGHRYYTDSDLAMVLALQTKQETNQLTIIYCRVSSPKQKGDLKRQVESMECFTVASGFSIDQVIEEVGGGLYYTRSKFIELIDKIEQRQVKRLIIAHKDRLCRFGYDFFELYAQRHGCEIIVANQQAMSPQQELVEDLMAVIHSFSGRLHGLRKYQKDIEKKITEPETLTD